MREIKFRAWLIAEKKMIDWFPQFFADHSPVTSYGNDFPDGEDVILMQFTGLHDNNGKEIYEGDFIGGIYESLYVGWCDKCASFQLLSAGYCFGCEGDINWLEFVNDETKEIIGNIYENPELLEGGK